MRLNKVIITIVYLSFTASVFGQHSEYLKFKNKYPKKSVVYTDISTEIDISLNDGKLDIKRTSHTRKILTDEKAKSYQKESIPFSDFNKIIDIKASSSVPTKNKYKTHKVKQYEDIETISEDYFYDKSYSKSFDYPHVKEGAVLNLEYTEEITDPIFMPSIYLGYGIPVERMYFRITASKDVKLKLDQFNTDNNLPIKISQKGNKNIYELELFDVEEIEYKSNGPSFQSITPHVAVNVASYKTKNGDVSVMENIDDLFKLYSGFIGQVDQNVHQNIIQTVDSIVIQEATELDKVKRIYNWVQSNIKYLAFEDNMGGFVPRDPQLVYDRRYGDCKDMSAIMVKMLDLAGIKGHYAWVGTRSLPYKYTEVSGLFIDNHMIAVYKDPDSQNYYFLDATNSYLPFGLTPSHIQDKEVLIYKDSARYDIYKAPITSCSQNLLVDKCTLEIQGDSLVGQDTVQIWGYRLEDFMYKFDELSQEDFDKKAKRHFRRGNNKANVDDINVNSSKEKIEVSFNLEIPNYISVVDDEIYINLNLNKELDIGKIDDNRSQAIDLGETVSSHNTVRLIIPDGYQLSYLPEDYKYSVGDFSASIQYEAMNNVIKCETKICLDALWIEPSDFEDWNTFIKKIKKIYRENITLSKL